MVQIFTDTAANLPMKLLEEYGIRTVPLSYEVDGVEPDHSIEFNGPAFYEAMRKGASVKTSMVNPEQAARAIEESLEAGMDVLYLGISGGISGSCWGVGVQCRELEEKYGPGRIAVVDTRGASLGEGLVVIETARLAKEGRSLAELEDFAKSRCARMQQFFVVDDLKYLHKGGRISGGARLAGTLLQVKPILRGDEEGKIVVYDKVRGKKKALEALAAQCPTGRPVSPGTCFPFTSQREWRFRKKGAYRRKRRSGKTCRPGRHGCSLRTDQRRRNNGTPPRNHPLRRSP